MGESNLRSLATMEKRMKKQQSMEILDELELLSKFVMEPNLHMYGFDNHRFKHINKTWFTTNTSTQDAVMLRRLSESIQILNNFREEEIDMMKVRDPETGKEFEVENPEYWNRFQDVIDVLNDNISSINASSAGKFASVLKLMRSIIQKQDQTLEDKSSGKRGSFFSFGKKNKGE